MRASLLLSLALFACSGSGKDTDPVDTDPDPVDDTVDTAGGADGNDDITTADDLTGQTFEEIGFNGLVNGAIEPAGDRDFYAITLEEGVPYVLYTLAWDETTDTVVLDTVIRLYDNEGNFIAENDDMIYRFRETDSGLWYMPDRSGTYYVEVLEFGDWDGSGASGGRDYEYTLSLGRFELTEHEGMNESIAEVMANTTLPDPTDTDTDVDEEADPVYYGGLFSNYDTHFFGSFQTAGDQDWYPVYIRAEDPEDDGYTAEPYFFLSASLWPNYGGNPRMSVYNSAGELMARTSTVVPTLETSFVIVTDSGILLRVDEGQEYYIVMDEEDGMATPGGFYAGATVNYLPSLATIEDADGVNDDQVTADLTITDESSTVDDLYFIGIWGSLPEADPADWFKLDKADVGGFDGKYVSVVVQAQTIGSLLDAKVKLVDPDGNTVVEASVDADDASIGDPTIVDFEIEADTNLFVVVEADGRDGPDTACNYLVGIYVGADPVFAE
jgi:hypothetical protein